MQKYHMHTCKKLNKVRGWVACKFCAGGAIQWIGEMYTYHTSLYSSNNRRVCFQEQKRNYCIKLLTYNYSLKWDK